MNDGVGGGVDAGVGVAEGDAPSVSVDVGVAELLRVPEGERVGEGVRECVAVGVGAAEATKCEGVGVADTATVGVRVRDGECVGVAELVTSVAEAEGDRDCVGVTELVVSVDEGDGESVGLLVLVAVTVGVADTWSRRAEPPAATAPPLPAAAAAA